MNQSHSELGFNGTWSMAVDVAWSAAASSRYSVWLSGSPGAWAWLSFATAGLIQPATGDSYVKLATCWGLEG